jgi:hypothetical protein
MAGGRGKCSRWQVLDGRNILVRVAWWYLDTFFLRNTEKLQMLIYTRIDSSLWTHARTSYLYEHLQETALKKLIRQVSRLMKSTKTDGFTILAFGRMWTADINTWRVFNYILFFI